MFTPVKTISLMSFSAISLAFFHYVFYGVTSRNSSSQRNRAIGTFIIANRLEPSKSSGSVANRITPLMKSRFLLFRKSELGRDVPFF